jgi:outer membrane protein TolC
LRRKLSHAARGLLFLAVAASGIVTPLSAQEPAGRARRLSLTLEDAVALALSRNHELAGARAELEGSGQRVREAWGSVYPKLNLVSSFTRSLSVPMSFIPKLFIDPTAPADELIAVQFGADNAWALQLRAEQPVFDAAVFLGVGAAGRYEMLQDETVRGRAQGVVTSTRVAYYDVLLADEALRLNENSVRRVRQVLEETEALHRAGMASEYDVLRLRVELANLEPNLRRTRNAASAARRNLGVVTGLDTLTAAIELVGTLATLGTGEEAGWKASAGGDELVDLDAMSADDVVALALRSRSDLRQLEHTERLRQTEVRVERVEYLPKVSVFGLYTINAQQSGSPDFFGYPRAYGRQVGVQVSMPLFSGFQRPARLGQKEAALRQVRIQRELTGAQAENEVRTLYDAAHEAGARAEAQRLAVAQAQRGFQIATAQYREGLGSQLAVTDAEVALRQSEFNLAEAVYDYLVARARLDEAAGRVPMVDAGYRSALGR